MSSNPVRLQPTPRRFTRAIPGALLVLTLFTASCDDSPTDPTDIGPITEAFSSNIQPRGTVSRSFLARDAGAVIITFLSLSVTDVEMAIGFGTTDAEGRNCTITTTVTGKADPVNPLISTLVTAGNYCVQISDPGNLIGLATFTITFQRP